MEITEWCLHSSSRSSGFDRWTSTSGPEKSSNAALHVEPERVREFTDCRNAEAARAIDGVEFVEAKRDLYQTLSEVLTGRIGFEGSSLSFERYSRLHAGGVEPVPTYGLIEELRVVKDEDELATIRPVSTSESVW